MLLLNKMFNHVDKIYTSLNFPYFRQIATKFLIQVLLVAFPYIYMYHLFCQRGNFFVGVVPAFFVMMPLLGKLPSREN